MAIQNHWILKGTFYECCRVDDGHCALWFGRDLPRACSNLATYQIKEGQIRSIDMQGITIMFHQDGIGPKVADLMQGAREGAIYISDNATGEQREILESFAREHMDARMWKKCLGVKFVNIAINKDSFQYHIIMPYGELKMSLAIGGDRKNPMRLENPPMPFLSNVNFCNTHFWKYRDYGKNLAFQNTSGAMADFVLKGH
jgi:Protein of unknown function (DUF1326)